MIHYFVALDFQDMIYLLESYGADINIRDSVNGLTPLVVAAAKGLDKMARVLVSLGAEILTKVVEENSEDINNARL